MSFDKDIDFENFDNNTFNVVTELTYKKVKLILSRLKFCQAIEKYLWFKIFDKKNKKASQLKERD